MKLKKYAYLLGLATAALTTACSDQSDEITSIDYDRLFAPINVEARVVNQVNARLSWAAVNGATSYTIEIFENDSLTFSGSPVKTIPGIIAEDLPYIVTGLEGEMKYSARVQAIGENISESKWSGVYFKTDAEQIFKSVTEEDLSAFSVTLHWTAGETATEIVLTPGNIKHTVTSAEIAAGAATIEGLTSETEYTAKLMNGTKTRGTVKFTTLVDLGGAIPVTPEDDFAALLAAANDGDAFAFYPGTYRIAGSDATTPGKIAINKSVEFKAVRPSDKPVLNGCITLNNGASLTLKQIILDGKDTDGSQTVEFKTATAYKNLIIDDCEIRNYTKGLYYINVAATIDEITIKNSLIYNIECNGGDMLDCRKGAIKSLNITNCTVYNSCAARDFVRYDDASGDFAGITPVITIDHCTLNGVSNNEKRLFYVRFIGNKITFTNNLVTNTGGYFSDQDKTGIPTFKNNNYFKAPSFISDYEKAKFFDSNSTSLDPGFNDAANGDFTITNETLIEKNIGNIR